MKNAEETKKTGIEQIKERVKDVMALRQSLILAGVSKDEIDEVIRAEGAKYMKKYAAMGATEFFVEVIADIMSRTLAAMSEKEKHPSETE